MKKLTLFICCTLFIINLSSCNVEEDKLQSITESELNALHMPVIEFIQNDHLFEIHGCYSRKDEITGLMTLFLEVNEEADVDYETYKSKIWDAVGVEFNIIYELIPFPDHPIISGVIRDIDYTNELSMNDFVYRLLVVSQESDFIAADGEPYYDASFISVSEDDVIENHTGEPLSFSDLKEGMWLASYSRGMTLETYPSMQGTEKLVVDNYELPLVKDHTDEKTFKNKFDSINYMGPFPLVLQDYHREVRLEEWDTRIYLYMNSGLVYYGTDQVFDDIELFEGPLNWNFDRKEEENTMGKIDNVILYPSEEILVTYTDEDHYLLHIPISENGIKQIVIFSLYKSGEFERETP